jgi:hypothetical protein
MSIDWQNDAPERGRALLPESFKPKELRLATAAETFAAAYPLTQTPSLASARSLSPAQPATVHLPAPADGAASCDPAPIVDLSKLEAELGRKRLDEIADVVRALTYGEMIELAESMWNIKPDNSELNEGNLPAILYRWSTSRQS